MKLQKRLYKNNEGITTFNLIIGVAIIGFIIWQFVFPIFGYESLFESYETYVDEQAENLSYNFNIIDSISNGVILPTDTHNFDSTDNDFEGAILFYDLDKTDAVSIRLITNIPYSLTNPYHIRFIHRECRYQYNIGELDDNFEFLTSENIVLDKTGKLGTDNYIYNLGSELKLNDGIAWVYGNYYEIIVLSPNSEILYQNEFLLRMDE